MNAFPLSRPVTLDEFVKGYANGGEVESFMPTDEDNFLRTLPPVQIDELADRYGVAPEAAGFDPSSLSQEDRSALMSALFAQLAGAPPIDVGAGFTGLPSGIPAQNLITAGSGGRDLEAGSLYDPNTAATEFWKQAAGERGMSLQQQMIEAEKAKFSPEQYAALEKSASGLAQAQAEKTAAAKEGYVATLPQRKELSSLLKANKFEAAFDYAKKNDVLDLLTNPAELKNLRDPFTKDELTKFMKAVPSDLRGKDFKYNPEAGVEYAINQWSGSETGFPDALAAFKYEQPLTAIDAIIRLGGAAVLGAGALSALGGAAGAGAGAAGAGSTAAGAGATSSGGFLTGLKTAATKVLGIPEAIGKTVAAQLGAGAVQPVTAKMIGNAIISGGVTGAKGGDLEDVLKSAAMAAGLTFVSDKVISSVAQKLQDSRILEAAKDIPGGDVAAVSPTAAANVVNNVAQGLENFAGEFAVTTFAPSAAAAGLANVGALTAAQAAVQPSQPAPEQVAPEDQIAADITVSTSAPDFGAGLETGAYTGYKLASDQGVGAEEPAVTEQSEIIEEPVEEIKVSTEGEQLDISDPFIQSLINQYTPDVTQPETGYATPEEIAQGEITVEATPDQLDFSDPFIQSLINQYTPDVSQPETGYATPEEIAEGEIKVEATPDQLDASDVAIQTIMDKFEPAPIDPETGMAEIEVSTDNLDLTDPLTQVLVNRFDIETPEPVTDDLEEFTIETDRPIDQGILEYAPPIFTPVNPADIAKDYTPTKVKSKFEELMSKYGTIENLLKAASLFGAAGGTKAAPTTGAGAIYDPRTSAGAGAWIDWEKVKAEADAAGMNLNTYTARNWNKIQNRALEAGAPAAVAPVTPQGYNLPDVGGENMMISPETAQPNFDLLKYLEEYQPEPLAFGGMAKGSNVKGPGHGREDLIPALLSDGEYVIDAETMALLGNGSTDAGAKMMDGFRENIRKHKGAKLAKGGISPNAKSPLQYLRGA